jgi:hypothetical protein
MAGSHRTIAIARIRLDGGTQLRAEVEQAVVADYADGLRGGAVFPPVVVFDDGKDKWLADGFLPVEAHKQVGRREIAVDLRPEDAARRHSFRRLGERRPLSRAHQRGQAQGSRRSSPTPNGAS